MLRTTLTRNRRILLPVLRGVAAGVFRRAPEFRHHVVRDAWTVAKRFGAQTVENVELREIPCIRDAIVAGYLDDYQRLVIATLARGLECRTFLEIGTNRGRTTWTVARNNPELVLYTLDVSAGEPPDEMAFDLGTDDRTFFRDASCGEAFRDSPESARITQLWGDSATFDFSPYSGTIDMVYIDGAHTYEYVKSDTANALRVLSPTGMIIWDDYTTGSDVYDHVTQIAASLDHPVFHLFGTRMAIYSRRAFVERLPPSDHVSLPTV
jgi:predicted O-methyltransferase YrrM